MKKWFPKIMRRKEKLNRDYFKNAVGLCRECWEHTSVLNPCCGGDVEFNNIIFTRDDFEDEDFAIEGATWGERRQMS